MINRALPSKKITQNHSSAMACNGHINKQKSIFSLVSFNCIVLFGQARLLKLLCACVIVFVWPCTCVNLSVYCYKLK